VWWPLPTDNRLHGIKKGRKGEKEERLIEMTNSPMNRVEKHKHMKNAKPIPNLKMISPWNYKFIVEEKTSINPKPSLFLFQQTENISTTGFL